MDGLNHFFWTISRFYVVLISSADIEHHEDLSVLQCR